MNTRHDTAIACNSVGSSISNIYGHKAGSNGQDITHSWSFFFKFHSLSSPSHDETLCHKLHIGRLWYHDAQQDACATCALWRAAEGTLDTGRGSPDACHCESSAGTLSWSWTIKDMCSVANTQLLTRNCPLMKMVKCH
jgi:hypothetical protein